MYAIIILVLLNILFVWAVWNMDIHSGMDRRGNSQAEKAYRLSEYSFIFILTVIDIIFAFIII